MGNTDHCLRSQALIIELIILRKILGDSENEDIESSPEESEEDAGEEDLPFEDNEGIEFCENVTSRFDLISRGIVLN